MLHGLLKDPRGVPRMRWPVGVTAVAAVVAVGPAVAAAAPVITTGATCLRPSQKPGGQLVAPALRVAGTGFTPGAPVLLMRDLRESAQVAQADGSLRASLSVIDLVSSQLPEVRSVTVSAVDGGHDAAPARASNRIRVKVAPLAFSVVPARAEPQSRVRFRFSGFTPGRTIHAHYTHRGRLMASVPMAAAARPCGTASVVRRQFPMARPQPGRWRVQFDNRTTYSPTARPRARAAITVYRAAG